MSVFIATTSPVTSNGGRTRYVLMPSRLNRAVSIRCIRWHTPPSFAEPWLADTVDERFAEIATGFVFDQGHAWTSTERCSTLFQFGNPPLARAANERDGSRSAGLNCPRHQNLYVELRGRGPRPYQRIGDVR